MEGPPTTFVPFGKRMFAHVEVDDENNFPFDGRMGPRAYLGAR
jgi:hypothetical protein